MSFIPDARWRALRAWRPEQLDIITLALRKAMAAWAGDWGLPHTLGTVQCIAAEGESATRVHEWMGSDDQAAAWLHDEGLPARIAAELFGCQVPEGGIAAEVATACGQDLRARLCAALGLRRGEADAPAAAPRRCRAWDGYVNASLPFSLELLLNAPAVEAVLCRANSLPARPTPRPSERSALAPVLKAVSFRDVPLEIELDGCDIDIGSLQALRAGDVLRIAHPLDAPARVSTVTGAPLFCGFLAGSRGHKAVELAPALHTLS